MSGRWAWLGGAAAVAALGLLAAGGVLVSRWSMRLDAQEAAVAALRDQVDQLSRAGATHPGPRRPARAALAGPVDPPPATAVVPRAASPAATVPEPVARPLVGRPSASRADRPAARPIRRDAARPTGRSAARPATRGKAAKRR